MLRSAEATLLYVGQLITAKQNGREVAIFGKREVPLFSVGIGEPKVGTAAVSVTHEDKTYYIKKFGHSIDDETMPVLSLMTQILNQLQEADELPTAAAVRTTN